MRGEVGGLYIIDSRLASDPGRPGRGAGFGYVVSWGNRTTATRGWSQSCQGSRFVLCVLLLLLMCRYSVRWNPLRIGGVAGNYPSRVRSEGAYAILRIVPAQRVGGYIRLRAAANIAYMDSLLHRAPRRASLAPSQGEPGLFGGHGGLIRCMYVYVVTTSMYFVLLQSIMISHSADPGARRDWVATSPGFRDGAMWLARGRP